MTITRAFSKLQATIWLVGFTYFSSWDLWCRGFWYWYTNVYIISSLHVFLL